jgi:hypothetical protein
VFQLRVREVAWFVAPFVGNARDGAAGIAIVVKFQTFDHLLVPPALVAFTSQ